MSFRYFMARGLLGVMNYITQLLKKIYLEKMYIRLKGYISLVEEMQVMVLDLLKKQRPKNW
jgi:hypothetical protein